MHSFPLPQTMRIWIAIDDEEGARARSILGQAVAVVFGHWNDVNTCSFEWSFWFGRARLLLAADRDAAILQPSKCSSEWLSQSADGMFRVDLVSMGCFEWRYAT